VDVYVVFSEFSRKKFIQGGLPADRIVVKPNFVYPDPGGREDGGNYALFVGRLSVEKGVRTLLRAWHNLRDIPIRIVGDGPLLEETTVSVLPVGSDAIDLLGRRSNREAIDLMKGARFLVFPSEWYEGFPVTLVEAFACGLPVIASCLGAMNEIVEDRRTGLHFNPGDPDDLAAKVAWLWSHPAEAEKMGREARAEFEAKYTAERNYKMLMEIYETALRKEQ
jgi:glycosyltransferase involved in cell wall biosynthesis